MSRLVPKLRYEGFSGEWEEDTLGNIVKFLDGKRKPIKESDRASMQGEYPYYGASGVIDYVNNYIFDEDLILLGEDGENIVSRNSPLVFKVSGKCWINNHAHVLKPNKPHNLDFFVQYMETLSYLKYNSGGAQPKLNQAVCKTIPLIFPKPKEQKKIANCLSSLDSLIEAQNKKVEALKMHKKGLMQQLFPSEGETVPKLRFDGFCGEWEEKTLLKLAKFRRGSFPQPYGLPEWYDDVDGTPFIQVFDVDYNLKLKSNTKRKISTLGAKQSVFIPKETVIVTIQGSIGRVAITQYDAYIDRTLLLFERFHQKIDKLFFAYTIENLFEIEKKKAPGGIIKTITKEVLSSFIVKLPSFKEQEMIANNLYSLDNLIEVQENKVKSLKKHKKGLMQQMFVSSEVGV